MRGKILIKALENEQLLLVDAVEKYMYQNGEKTEDKEIHLTLFVLNETHLNNQQLRVKLKHTNSNLQFVKEYMYKIIDDISVFENIKEDEAFDFNSKANVSYISFSADRFNPGINIEI